MFEGIKQFQVQITIFEAGLSKVYIVKKIGFAD